MPTLRIPDLMKYYVAGQTVLPLNGATIAEVISDLVTLHPAIQPHILDKTGKPRRYVNFFINKVNIKDLNGLETPVQPDDTIILLPSISGG